MKQYLYVIIEAILSIVMLSGFVWLCYIQFNIFIIALALLGSLYFIGKIIIGAKLLIDIIDGPKEKLTVFMGCLEEEHLDFFARIKYTTIYFDDDLLTKNYLLFEKAYCEELHRGDKITVLYFKRSRIVLQLLRT